MIFEKTEVLFCYRKYPILILMNEPLLYNENPYCEACKADFGVAEVKPVQLKIWRIKLISGLPK